MSDEDWTAIRDADLADIRRRVAEYLAGERSREACQGIYLVNEATGEVTHLGNPLEPS